MIKKGNKIDNNQPFFLQKTRIINQNLATI